MDRLHTVETRCDALERENKSLLELVNKNIVRLFGVALKFSLASNQQYDDFNRDPYWSIIDRLTSLGFEVVQFTNSFDNIINVLFQYELYRCNPDCEEMQSKIKTIIEEELKEFVMKADPKIYMITNMMDFHTILKNRGFVATMEAISLAHLTAS